MPRSINSFDVFDTLIARRSGEPHSILIQLESRANLPGLASHRLAADQTIGARGQPYELQAIWNEVGRTMGLDASTIAGLMNLEIRIEHEEVIGIAENLALVRDWRSASNWDPHRHRIWAHPGFRSTPRAR
jgi:hypothetical protein